MAVKKSAEAPSAAINIEQMADLYLKYYNEKKELEKKEKAAKDALLLYAKNNTAKFEGSALKFSNGVYIERRFRTTSSYDESKIHICWISELVDEGHGELIDIKFDDKKLSEMEVPDLFNEIDYKLETKESFAVCTTK